MDTPEQLLEKFRRNACTEAELQALHRWLEGEAAKGHPYAFQSEAEREALKRSIRSNIEKALKPAAPVRRMSRNWWRYAAVLFIVITGAAIFYNINTKEKMPLASGIRETRQFTLPDGSKVWLNANTRLQYAKNFAANRSVYLEQGEAFFEVQHDTLHPFRVYCNEVYTQVLGTSFSVKRLAGNDVKVSVVTGKVKVFNKAAALAVLTPGMGIHYSAMADSSTGTKITSQEAKGWIEGDIILSGASIQDISQLLTNNYNVQVAIETTRHTSHNIYLHINKDIPLSGLLEILNLIGAEHQLQFTQSDNTIHITDKLN
ncbi:FecR family protein [Paraflavitalea sp. CAU 1676]|uniref:FecR family protein n=1 Tax=Paraflavitalea sp. CAU 1676 TaxID=3032598 RepID=UPI0023DA2D77|nr:FecR family protein [Paraflavitalea sp. CAU 1676]MDF2192425.1 FecR domain-containing protein [Paraflavitalea sp. CAU 1676]